VQPCSRSLCSRSPRSTGAERLFDRRPQRILQILRRNRTNQFVGDLAVAADHERLRYAVDAPFDRGTAGRVGARGGERIAVTAEKAPRILGLILVVEAGAPGGGAGKRR